MPHFTYIMTFLRSTTVALCLVVACHAFAPIQQQQHSSHLQQPSTHTTRSTTYLKAGIFGESGILGGLFGSPSNPGPKTVVDLPASNVKVGALRFLLNIYLVGEQNKPEPKSWLTRQQDDGTLQIYYLDGTGMLALDLQEYGIKAIRYGEAPSLQYVLQESILLQGILDELSGLAFDVEAEPEKRLLQLADEEAIVKARETLPARKE